MTGEEIKLFLKRQLKDDKSVEDLTKQVLTGAQAGLEISESCPFEEWFSQRFSFQFVWLDNSDYTKALVRALRLAPKFAGTDFGGSRQRDLGQVWTDTARGFLGEIALSKFLREKFGVETKIDTSVGDLKEYLPTDIKEVKLPGQDWKQPALKISIKTSKFNARWLDLPGAQFEHSDVFVLVKIGILRQHFLAFLKAISFLKDKLFVTAKSLGELNDENAKELWNEIPAFEPIPSYIAGFLLKEKIKLPIHEVIAIKKGQKRMRIVITQGVGNFSPETVRNHQEIRNLDPRGSLPIEVEPIIKSLTGSHFLAHSGFLKCGKEKWRELISELSKAGNAQQLF